MIRIYFFGSVSSQQPRSVVLSLYLIAQKSEREGGKKEKMKKENPSLEPTQSPPCAWRDKMKIIYSSFNIQRINASYLPMCHYQISLVHTCVPQPLIEILYKITLKKTCSLSRHESLFSTTNWTTLLQLVPNFLCTNSQTFILQPPLVYQKCHLQFLLSVPVA